MASARARSLAILLALSGLVSGGSWPVAGAAAAVGVALDDGDLAALLAKAADYVVWYERELGSVIADEEYTQHEVIGEVSGLRPDVGLPTSYVGRKRRLHSEFMLLWLPAARDRVERWIAFRHVLEVNGKPISDSRARLEDRLRGATGDTTELYRQLAEESARYNFGRIRRNVNYPTFALVVLRAPFQPRFAFRDAAGDRVAGVRVRMVTFQERGVPTIVTNPQGGDVVSSGTVWVAPTTGAVLRTRIRTWDRKAQVQSDVTVSYRKDDRLQLWVPATMTEIYEAPHETPLRCEARYSNVRRFEASARLVVPER